MMLSIYQKVHISILNHQNQLFSEWDDNSRLGEISAEGLKPANADHAQRQVFAFPRSKTISFRRLPSFAALEARILHSVVAVS